MLEKVGQLQVSVHRLPLESLLQRVSGGIHLDEAALRRRAVSYVRETLCDYDRGLEAAAGEVAGPVVATAIKRKVYREIARTYPELAGECRHHLKDACQGLAM